MIKERYVLHRKANSNSPLLGKGSFGQVGKDEGRGGVVKSRPGRTREGHKERERSSDQDRKESSTLGRTSEVRT